MQPLPINKGATTDLFVRGQLILGRLSKRRKLEHENETRDSKNGKRALIHQSLLFFVCALIHQSLLFFVFDST